VAKLVDLADRDRCGKAVQVERDVVARRGKFHREVDGRTQELHSSFIYLTRKRRYILRLLAAGIHSTALM
jgi:predicted nucleic acid-binding Zn finger protein